MCTPEREDPQWYGLRTCSSAATRSRGTALPGPRGQGPHPVASTKGLCSPALVGKTPSQVAASPPSARRSLTIVDGQLDVAQCVRRCLTGEREAYRSIVEHYQSSIYRLALRLTGHPEDARELTQEAFLKAYAALERYDPERRFASWLYRIAINGCVDRIRSRRLELREDLQPEDPAPHPDEALERRENDAIVQRALLRLPVAYRLALVLKDIEGASYSDMSEMLDESIPALKIRVVRARKQLADKIRKMHPGLVPDV